MPLVPIDPVKMLHLFEGAERCMVSVTQIEGTRASRAGSGFVVHCDEQCTVVAVHPSFHFQGFHNGRTITGPKAGLEFYDGTGTTNTRFIRLERSVNLVVASIPLGHWRKAVYEQLNEVHREDVMSIVSLFHQIMPFIGRVISPRSTSVNASGNVIVGSSDRFTFNLPLAGHMHHEESADFLQRFELLKNQVLGSPVFNFNGGLVGFVDRCGYNFDFKFGVRVEELNDVIRIWLSGRKWKDAIDAHIAQSR